MAKQKKKRNKNYRPAGALPTVHRYVAETEAKVDRHNVWKRRIVIIIIGLIPLWLVLIFIF